MTRMIILGSPLPTRAAKKAKTADGTAATDTVNPQNEEAGTQQTERQVATARPK